VSVSEVGTVEIEARRLAANSDSRAKSLGRAERTTRAMSPASRTFPLALRQEASDLGGQLAQAAPGQVTQKRTPGADPVETGRR
jgi:hypothetical protein